MSDHFGLMAYVDVHDAYSSRKRSAELVARSRRGQLVAMRELAMQKEAVEAKAMLQHGREE